MAKISNEEKLKALRHFLNVNKIPFINNYHSKIFNVDMAIKVKKLRIAVFISNDDKEFEDSMVFAKVLIVAHLYEMYIIHSLSVRAIQKSSCLKRCRIVLLAV
jgi:hypothetical protein